MFPIRIREGFKNQLLYVIPRNTLPRLAEHPLLYPLMPTDMGWYPNARYHYCEREHGAPEHILILCVAGTGWYEIKGARRPLHPNEALLIPSNTPHIYGASDQTPWSIYWLHFVGSHADIYAHQVPTDSYTVAVDSETTEQLRQLFLECCHAFATHFVLPRMIYASQTLHHFLARLFFNNRAFSPTLQTSRFHNLDATLAYLQQHVHHPLTLADMADHAQLSVSHFSRLFKEQTGHSPMDYFIHLKIQHACKLLTLTRMSVREVADDLGYVDAYYFSRLFKKIIGVSPAQYRNRPQGELIEPPELHFGDG